ncbi:MULTISPECIES: iron-sulfur cluster repair di-iron protein [unclassified Sinorhizobium]|uniref:iron-sulfur cluster repair di-iron protein n=1 Tax=unclassified Sinorhizobium TaxID=2613772 RepID=UPI0024C2684D|nr:MULTISPECIES: iron-sulfur cluster repair di-iron protein [unclassified Sinorhizobium]MDK1373735.1 iron-sulfur cluster repair di-iron protein [Sinorhizobium sp. 6-70]MDK1478764.1 iron-sulfur cluster repair di-iron protein [Sinorhizobium sp. 6-117]
MTGISLDKTVTTIAAELPGAAELFRRHDISFCCGGNVRLSEAAVKAGLAPSALLSELEALVDAARRDAPEETPDLIAHILARYHETHRSELAWLIPLAQKVERVHADHPSAPIGLSQTLEHLRDELQSHMVKEELVLFPMMRSGGSETIVHPIAQMRHEHDDEAEHLRTIEHLTHGLSLPAGACGSWTALYTGLRKFTDDLVAHMHLENAVLFPRFEPA